MALSFKEIVDATRTESEARRLKDSLKSLKTRMRDAGPTRGFARALRSRDFSIIAEVKQRSPSMGRMAAFAEADALRAHKIYDRHPAVSAISVLTQQAYFGGTPQLLRLIHRETRKPVLRKDFIFSEYEVYYSRHVGADAILLMTNVVTDPREFADLHDLAVGLGMDVLCEVHTEAELEILPESVRICGINSRKFGSDKRFFWSQIARKVRKDVTVDLSTFDLYGRLAARLPAECLKVAESGVTASNIDGILAKYGFNAALIGTALLKGGHYATEAELDKLQAAIERARPSHEGKHPAGTATKVGELAAP